jgi:cytoskeletal protein CcmA (bactofilin family)
MAFFKDSNSGTRDPFAGTPSPAAAPAPAEPTRAADPVEPARRPVERTETRSEAPPANKPEAKESFISAELTLEGKIEGAGNVRVAGRFKGDVNVQGDLTIEKGAQIAGQVHARTVVVEGTLEGNIVSAERVELRASAVLNGDVKAGALIVAAGSKMRGNAEFGWEGAAPAKPAIRGVG